MSENDPNAADHSRRLACAHFIACYGVRYDSADADAGHTLERVIVQVRPRDGNGFPFRVARLFVYAQLFGTTGDYAIRVHLLRIGTSDEGETVLTRREFGPMAIQITGENYVEGFAIPLADVWFAEPGVYEFQLWADGFDDPLAGERVQARG